MSLIFVRNNNMKIESDQCCEIFFLSTLLLMKDQGSSHGHVSPSIFWENTESAVQIPNAKSFASLA